MNEGFHRFELRHLTAGSYSVKTPPSFAIQTRFRTFPQPLVSPNFVGMGKNRLEAFSDGVFAIIITVLELRVPHSAGLAALVALWPVFLSYVLSFVFLGIYWNNHHHMFHAVDRINGKILWANLHLLFWLSLTPFVTAWMGENHAAPLPTALYGAVLLLSAIAYTILQSAIIAAQGPESKLKA